ncbi:hypothetical protein [Pseudoxanthomonas japonensis]|uniref:hypothetical protein n=1 Tax=Pseudoxanthomonas japonensis TaxID=69284 RepID=UPI001BCD70BA|nr:hypothetical protein [Pseudoxanthomonas japonensis]
MNLRQRGLGFLLAFLAVPASATLPTHEQVRQLQQLFGFDSALVQVMETEIGKEPAFADMAPAQRTCLLARIEPIMSVKLVDAFRTLFGDEQTAGQWIAFAETEGGGKLMQFVRKGVESSINGQPAPEPESMLGGLPQAAMMQVVEFMGTPAAKVLEREFPDLDMTDAELDAFKDDAQTHCGIEDTTL